METVQEKALLMSFVTVCFCFTSLLAHEENFFNLHLMLPVPISGLFFKEVKYSPSGNFHL